MSNKVTKPLEEEKPEINSTIGEKIDYIRRKNGLTQKELAKKINTDEKTIKRYENNKAKVPVDKLVSIAKNLNVSTDYLLGLNDVETYNIKHNAINKEIGISAKSINILKHNKNLANIISFLIEQEEIVLLGDLPPIEGTKLTKEQYEKAENEYNTELDRILNTCFPILSTINNYFSIKLTNEDFYIMPNGKVKKLNDFKLRIDRLLAVDTINTKELIEKTFLEKIESLLKNAKIKYEKKGASKK